VDTYRDAQPFPTIAFDVNPDPPKAEAPPRPIRTAPLFDLGRDSMAAVETMLAEWIGGRLRGARVWTMPTPLLGDLEVVLVWKGPRPLEREFRASRVVDGFVLRVASQKSLGELADAMAKALEECADEIDTAFAKEIAP
jgi:hypothetical protein